MKLKLRDPRSQSTIPLNLVTKRRTDRTGRPTVDFLNSHISKNAKHTLQEIPYAAIPSTVGITS